MAPQDALLEAPRVRRASSSVDVAIQQCCQEIERWGNLLIRGSKVYEMDADEMDINELMLYSALAGNLGTERMREMGYQIAYRGCQIPIAEITEVIQRGKTYVLSFVEVGSGRKFTLPCSDELKDYVDGPIDLERVDITDYLRRHDYLKRQVTLDVARNGSRYEVSQIGLASMVLEDARLETPLHILN